MIIKEIPYLDPLAVCECFQSSDYCFFLDSGMDYQRLGRYSFLGWDPFLVFRSEGREVQLWEEGAWRFLEADPFAVLQELLNKYALPLVSHVPVPSGAFGYFAYDLGWQLEKLPNLAVNDLQVPDCYLGFYDRLIILDNLEQRAYLTSTGLPASGSGKDRRAQSRLEEMEALLDNTKHNLQPLRIKEDAYAETKDFQRHFTRSGYAQTVQAVKDYIAAGDIFQVNLSQRFSAPLNVHPWLLYKRLRRLNPAPFAAYLKYPEMTVVSASPERFLKVRQGLVETRPIKGTRRRGSNPLEDRKLREELLKSDKDHAELVMIIDLERNDLGRVCSFGSVHVPELFCLEEYPTVFHLVATVRGELLQGKDLVDLLRATFPGGSIIGAPKIRAMEIIEELEPVKRGVYTGAIGYLGFEGSADLNIVIRTFTVKNGRAYYQVGGGIVADSDPDAEYWETIDKGRALLQALGLKEEVLQCQV